MVIVKDGYIMHKISKFNTLISFYKNNRNQLDTGEVVTTKELIGREYAYLLYKNGKETINQGVDSIENTLSIRCRFNILTRSIDENHTIIYNDDSGRDFVCKILSISPDVAEKQFIDFIVQKGVIDFNNNNG